MYAYAMKPNQLFPRISPAVALEGIGKSPYLDLEWQFQLNLKEFFARYHDLKPYVSAGTSFEAYREQRRARSPLPQFFDGGGIFVDLDLFSDYVLGLHEEDVSDDLLVEVFQRFQKFVDGDVLEGDPRNLLSGPALISLLLAPAVRWAVLLPKRKTDVILPIETTLLAISGQLRGPRFHADLLTFQNALLFAYLVLAELMEVGVNPTIVSRHMEVFRSVLPSKWDSMRTDLRIQYATVIIALTRTFYPLDKPFETKLGFSLNVLGNLRAILDDAAGADIEAIFAPSQWVFRWHVDKLDVEVFASTRRGDLTTGLVALSPGEQNIAAELVRRFAAFRIPITVESLARFLVQFGTTRRVRGALRLLQHIKFYPLWELSQAIERKLAIELGGLPADQKLVVAQFGEHTGSAAIMHYLLAHSSLEKNIAFARSIPAALAATKRGDTIYIVDDCLLSGTQTLNTVEELMGTRVLKKHHTVHTEELSRADKRKLKRRNLKFTFSVAMDYGLKEFEKRYEKSGLSLAMASVLYGVLEPESSKVFEPLGPVGWLNEEEREDMKVFCADVGYQVLAKRAKSKLWDEDRRRQSALGFSDAQRLLVFPYNVPKTSLTLLWERSSDSFRWEPLFPGYD